MNGPAAWRVGIIGLGTVGAEAARQLLAAGPPTLALTVFDKDPAQCEPWRGSATLAASAQEALRESDLVLLALPGEREIDRTLERFSDGKVGADIRGKLIWNLRPLPDDGPAGALRRAVEAAGARYVAGASDPALANLREHFDAAGMQALLRAMCAA
ncbi:NAD(P)-binding domain-containing protein [Bordetella petrii]|uniref:Pyrroline-5-carboxylate reductase catalytic N-terminal domain-containing protein n=1 Tax=Bordetella petrii (strain ATCC BAA-461 / DSM 12804 / CCUG 43448 / CIP 107267 / Se-1111R) TaxID=340100 RepID=A9IHZ1_BORPD|nr:NAD(P)-binding domain-containing protein [Bordetella petrii]CAP42012.1 hypothetical protein Bpet1673 [Bordetella petrii]